MNKLKLSVLTDDKPVEITVEIDASVRRNLDVYAEILAARTNPAGCPGKNSWSDTMGDRGHNSPPTSA